MSKRVKNIINQFKKERLEKIEMVPNRRICANTTPQEMDELKKFKEMYSVR